MNRLVNLDDVIAMILKAADNPEVDSLPSSMVLKVLAASLKVEEQGDNE